MKKKNYIPIAKNIIELEIKALQALKKNINNSLNEAVFRISNCQSKLFYAVSEKVD